MSAAAAPLYGLVLAGGRSTRMQRDKATLEYRPGETQLEAAMRLLQPRVARAFVSVRSDQRADTTRSAWDLIVDRGDVEGPIAGISAALGADPDAAWLVLACDLPFLDAQTLDTLIAARDLRCDATAFRSSHDGLPEPLCAIYEPRARASIAAHIAGGRNCPRKYLINAQTSLLAQPNPRALDNVNTVSEYGEAMSTLGNNASAPEAGGARDIRVQYYALLREQAGRSAETVHTRARTPRELYLELRAKYPFTLPPEMLRVAINAEFGDWSQTLAPGDAVVFIPPVAGG
jgi:molybdopterin-guanine dinucleotide biosynthesis protein A